jgi:hypothetical protein
VELSLQFRELRLAAGYTTVGAMRQAFASRNLDLPTTTFYRLDQGGRPETFGRLTTVYRWDAAGRLPAPVKPFGSRRWVKDDVLKHIEQRCCGDCAVVGGSAKRQAGEEE